VTKKYRIARAPTLFAKWAFCLSKGPGMVILLECDTKTIYFLKKSIMKKLLLIPICCFTFSCIVNAQTDAVAVKQVNSLNKEEKGIKKEKKELHKEIKKLKGAEVSTFAKNKFVEDFGDLPGVTWRRDMNFDVATFTKDGMKESAYYDADAKLVGTTIKKTFADLPAAAQQHINKKYADYTKGDVLFFDDNEYNETDMILFGEQFNGEDNYLIELIKDGKKIVLQSNTAGEVSFFTKIK
jgi:hypothetical protein